jgi:hypothetical protein
VKQAAPRCDESIQVEEQMLALRQLEAQRELLPEAKRRLELAHHEYGKIQREVLYLEKQLQECSDPQALLIKRNTDDEVRCHDLLHFFG